MSLARSASRALSSCLVCSKKRFALLTSVCKILKKRISSGRRRSLSHAFNWFIVVVELALLPLARRSWEVNSPLDCRGNVSMAKVLETGSWGGSCIRVGNANGGFLRLNNTKGAATVPWPCPLGASAPTRDKCTSPWSPPRNRACSCVADTDADAATFHPLMSF